jgi:hypothetical protein
MNNVICSLVGISSLAGIFGLIIGLGYLSRDVLGWKIHRPGGGGFDDYRPWKGSFWDYFWEGFQFSMLMVAVAIALATVVAVSQIIGCEVLKAFR